jgi:RNA polymerase sigma factor (sigma-70 family)
MSINSQTFNTVLMKKLVVRYQQGDKAALSTLIDSTLFRLNKIARKLLNPLQKLRVHVDTGDVVNGSVIRLAKTLENILPTSVIDYYNQATEQLRLELRTLTRRFLLPEQFADLSGQETPRQLYTIQEYSEQDPIKELQLWHDFNILCEQLDREEKTVLNLLKFHGFNQLEVAELMGISDRQVRRFFHEANRKILRLLGRELPNIG